ncbi:hypothetical protein GCM10028778_07940 [Barrientosiimonas marina]|uniref:Uncharacterized protein n=1 Tax=Lentibacillus kimchii TaxID=1542911 RepID=A0ABW2UXM5_9BACI
MNENPYVTRRGNDGSQKKSTIRTITYDDLSRMAYNILQTLADHNMRLEEMDMVFDHAKKLAGCQTIREPHIRKFKNPESNVQVGAFLQRSDEDRAQALTAMHSLVR